MICIKSVVYIYTVKITLTNGHKCYYSTREYKECMERICNEADIELMCVGKALMTWLMICIGLLQECRSDHHKFILKSFDSN